MSTHATKLSERKLHERDVVRHAMARAIVEAREAAGLSQAAAARRAGLSRSSYINLELGEVGLTSDRFLALARALRTRPSVLWQAVEADEAAAALLTEGAAEALASDDD